MTRNQIEYLKYRESKRSNLSTEAIDRARNAMNYEYNMRSLDETSRHNQATEALTGRSIDESARHNMATEAYNTAYLAETNRSNLARESETNRHNVAVETETNRANLMSEYLRGEELSSLDNYRNQQIGLGYGQLAESVRHNTQVEAETKRSNKEHENITNRANLLNYSVQAERNSNTVIQNRIQNHQRDEELHLTARRDTVNAADKLVSGITGIAKTLTPFRAY